MGVRTLKIVLLAKVETLMRNERPKRVQADFSWGRGQALSSGICSSGPGSVGSRSSHAWMMLRGASQALKTREFSCLLLSEVK